MLRKWERSKPEGRALPAFRLANSFSGFADWKIIESASLAFVLNLSDVPSAVPTSQYRKKWDIFYRFCPSPEYRRAGDSSLITNFHPDISGQNYSICGNFVPFLSFRILTLKPAGVSGAF